jgi:hypothetical protein
MLWLFIILWNVMSRNDLANLPEPLTICITSEGAQFV